MEIFFLMNMKISPFAQTLQILGITFFTHPYPYSHQFQSKKSYIVVTQRKKGYII